MSQELIPYTFETEVLPYDAQEIPAPGKQGVLFTMSQEVYDWTLDRVRSWFAGRNEVSLIDYGFSEKRGLAFIVLEWIDREIDELFLAILRDEDFIEDYAVYNRSEEDC
jgi:hypothetical protein